MLYFVEYTKLVTQHRGQRKNQTTKQPQHT